MTPDDLIKLLIAIVGTLLGVVAGLFMHNINSKFNSIVKDISELKDMFVRHVRNDKIHLQPKYHERD